MDWLTTYNSNKKNGCDHDYENYNIQYGYPRKNIDDGTGCRESGKRCKKCGHRDAMIGFMIILSGVSGV